jgi:hypothetical protein
MVRQSPSEKLLAFTCNEFVDELLSQPASFRKLKLGSESIETVARTLDWEVVGESSSSYHDKEEISVTDAYLKPLNESDNMRLNLSVYFGNSWKQTSSIHHHDDQINNNSSNRLPPISSLPVGLRELLLHVEFAYSNNLEDIRCARLSKQEVIDSVGSSHKLGILHPYLIRLCIRRIRETIRARNIDGFLHLLKSIITNESYNLNGASDFELILNCLLNTILDVNLLRESDTFSEEMCMSTRAEATSILISLLSLKLGNYHSAELVRSLADQILTPFITHATHLKDLDDLGVFSALAGATSATIRFSSHFGIGEIPAKCISGIKRLLKSQKICSMFPVSSEIIRSELGDNF